MFEAKWKQELREENMSYFADLEVRLQERIAEEVGKGFDTRDEMKEVFLEIADEFDLSPDAVWSEYYLGDWK